MTAFSLTDSNTGNVTSLIATPDELSTLRKIGGFAGTGAEISAYDPTSKRLFIVSGGAEIQVLDLSNPTAPTLVQTIDLSTYGTANSVAVKNGLVAVAVEAEPKTNPGQVVFFDANGTVQATVSVGALPDMLTFTPDGKRVLVANEGEPNSYNQPDSIDPVGSISVIDLTNGVSQATVATAGFESFNNSKADLQAKGVRIFGPNATVAQDLEPEYITVSADGTTAWVTLQENNAIATVDIATATVTSIQPLGSKDFSRGIPTVTNYEFTDRPVLGTTATTNPNGSTETAAGQEILLGGFSGLFFEGVANNGNLKFIANTDRGPNGEPTDLLPEIPGNERPFALPDFQPELVRFELNRTTGEISITDRIGLTRPDGAPLTGLPNLQAGVAGAPYTDEVPVDLFGNRLLNDPLGADLEGVVVAGDGSFWMVDEYRPAIYHFSSAGELIDRFIPGGAPTNDAAFGTPTLPDVYAQRRSNRGFEAVALEGTKLYAFIQSPIDNPDSHGDVVSRTSRNLRILEFDTVTKSVTGEYLYILDDISASGNARTDKLGDAVALGNGKFLVVERDDRAGVDSNKLIYEIDLRSATNIHDPANLGQISGGRKIEQLTVPELISANLQPVSKRLVTNAAALGYTGVEKLEGLALIDPNTIALINDNDFGVLPQAITGDGTVPLNPTPTPVRLGIVEFNQSNGLDASDRDGSGTNGAINIRNQPVFGLYQPDAIASFTVNGQTYLITANEGDARDYDGFAEEVRVGSSSYTLDPNTFPNAADLRSNTALGRLTVTNASGDTDGDGDYDRIEVFGGRSFSIRTANGGLVYDSGDQLERITAAAVPELFNSNGDADTFDTRSDNKGPEPEGVVVGVVNGQTYAFVGLERTGGVVVYDVTNPNKPVFVEYVSTSGDVSPEGLTFIPAADSPNGKPLLVVTNEISGTTAIFEFNPQVRISDIQGTAHRSPLEGQTVNNVSGIVTVVRSNGFYLQDPNPDANEATSDAIFVFTSSNPTVQVGDSVRVGGVIAEFRPGGGGTNNLTTTQIGGAGNPAATFTVLSSGNPLPTATILGDGGRAIPNQVIDNDAVGGRVENPATPFDPAEDGIDFYESLEGMRVSVNDAIAVSPTNSFGEIAVLANNGANAGPRTARGGIYVQPGDFNPERIIIDDTLISNPPAVNVGDRFNGSITGVVDYSFGNFKLLNTSSLPDVIPGGLTREVTNLVGDSNRLTVGTFNVENLSPASGSDKFAALANRIVANLRSPDILSLEEIQDNSGPTNNGVTDASQTLQTLIDAIVAAGGPRYEFRQLNPENNQDGGQPGGNIRVGFLFNPDRVDFLEGSLQRLVDTDLSNGDAFTASRKPLVGEFLFNGNRVTVIGNHFNSKGGDQPLFGQFQPPTLNTEAQRLQQAQIVRGYVNNILSTNPNANVIVAGDLNDFVFSNPLAVLTQGGALVNLLETLPVNEQYTYIFDGNSQVLDHILVSNNLRSNAGAEVDIVHINAEFANQDSDHDPIVSRFQLAATSNVVSGGAGNDTLVGVGSIFYGRGGDDQIFSNGGESLIFGGAGNDRLFGSSQTDYIDGGASNDLLYSNGGNDTLLGGGGNDAIYGSSSDDLINGGSGNDLIFGNGGKDTLLGGTGDDIIYSGSNDSLIDGGAGNDTVWLSGGQDTIVLTTGAGTDTINNFQLGQTRFSLAGGLSFSDLTIVQGNGAALIQAGGEVLASVNWIQAANLTSASFLGV